MGNKKESPEIRYALTLRDQIEREIWEMITTHPNQGEWRNHISFSLNYLNSAYHPDVKMALELIVGDLVKAHQHQVPTDIVKFALGKAITWREEVVKLHARKDKPIVGNLEPTTIRKKLREADVPDKFIDQVF